ncbi:acyltransferase family protein [Paenarthrobacter sp. RAF54_2]|uniref:acyltransferase family protein n=1 Tax=Paenarthrobacter sp. RAF54_2 TaxID=3233061 RepID=UPI003F9591E6
MPSALNSVHRSTFRSDIAGLRTIAIVSVVLVHAGVSWIPGGFVGVDVFFVISGFLITGQLLRENEATGRINLPEFWARRARRLFPALAFVALTVLAVSPFIFSPLELKELASQAGAAVLSVSNVLFAFQAADYFGHEVQESPFLHTWSLGVEEQFYLALPLLFLLISWAARQLRWSMRLVALLSLASCLAVSFAASAALTPEHPFWAFYTIPTRAWEFAAGGILAVVIGAVNLSRTTAAVVASTGAAAIVVSCLFIGANQPFPGVVAALPAAGALLVILGGSTPNRMSSLFGTKLMVWTGERSYSWYLWHWPAVVLVTVSFDVHSVWLGLAASALALGLAHVTFLWVESPIRVSKALRASNRATYTAMSVGLVVCVLASAGIYASGSLASTTVENRTWLAVREQGAPQACPERRHADSGIAYCVSGSTDAAKTVMVIGDSHAAQWVPTLARVGAENGFRLVIRALDACPAADLTVLAHGAVNSDCDSFHRETEALIYELRPEVVLTANSNSYVGQIPDNAGSVKSVDTQSRLWRAGFASIIEAARASGAVAAVIEDTPRPGGDAGVCVTRPGGTEQGCSPTRSKAFEDIATLRDAERAVQEEWTINHVLSFDDHLCPTDTCLIADGGIPVFTDSNHLSQVWVTAQEPKVRDFISAALKAAISTP